LTSRSGFPSTSSGSSGSSVSSSDSLSYEFADFNLSASFGFPQILMSIFFDDLAADFLETGDSLLDFFAGNSPTSSETYSLHFFGLIILSTTFLAGLDLVFSFFFFGCGFGATMGSSTASCYSFGSSTSTVLLSSFFCSLDRSSMNYSRASSRMGAISATRDDLFYLSLI